MIKKCEVCGEQKNFLSYKSTTCQDCLDKGLKYCVHCHRTLSITMFGTVRLGLRGTCKDCHRETVKASVERTGYNSKPEVRKHKAEASRLRYANDAAYRLSCIGYVHERRAELSGTITDTDWSACLEYFNSTCAYCGVVADLTIEHVVPVSVGGSNTIDNAVCACKSCNSSKGAKDLMAWYPLQKFFSQDRLSAILYFIKGGE